MSKPKCFKCKSNHLMVFIKRPSIDPKDTTVFIECSECGQEQTVMTEGHAIELLLK